MCRKRVFSKAEAIAILFQIQSLRKMGYTHKRRTEKRHYFCSLCEGYHLTSQKKKQKKKKNKPYQRKALRFS